MTNSSTFVACFADGEITRLTTYCEPGKQDVGRGVRLAQWAYRSRMKSEPPAIVAASFEHNDGRNEPVESEALRQHRPKASQREGNHAMKTLADIRSVTATLPPRCHGLEGSGKSIRLSALPANRTGLGVARKSGATFIFEEDAMPTLLSYRDRAATLAVDVLQIIDTAPKQSARQELEKYLRDELADLARQVAAERELSSDA